MPSPFPGMDPYLEDPGLWPDVHHEIISVARSRLTGLLRPRYIVRIEERTYITDERDPAARLIIPDLKVRETAPETPASVPRRQSTETAISESIMAVTFTDVDVREGYLKVMDAADRSVVAVIEVLSPANKCPGSRGMESYYEKRREIMRSECHLVEIDLLRSGTRIPFRGRVPQCDYLMHVSRSDQRPRRRRWPVSLRNRLPSISIPLRGDDPDVVLDLQGTLEEAYERGAYDLEVDYGQSPVPHLQGNDAEWADRLLRDRGLRE